MRLWQLSGREASKGEEGESIEETRKCGEEQYKYVYECVQLAYRAIYSDGFLMK